MPPLVFLVPGDPETKTGGYGYDRRLAGELTARGWRIELKGLTGAFPDGDDAARSLDQALTALPENTAVLIDGLALGGLPDIARAHADRLKLLALVHHPLADETGLRENRRARLFESEKRALRAVRGVLVTSRFTARRLADFEVPEKRVGVAPPGVDRAPVAQGSIVKTSILSVGTVTPRKGHDVLFRGLAPLTNLVWKLDVVGSMNRDPEWARDVETLGRSLNLAHRIFFHGEVSDGHLAEYYDAADLLVVSSHYEGYGMVLTEALARGLPVVTTTGGALADTLPPGGGIQIPPGDDEALSTALKPLLTSSESLEDLGRRARAARDALPAWEDTARLAGEWLKRVLEE